MPTSAYVYSIRRGYFESIYEVVARFPAPEPEKVLKFVSDILDVMKSTRSWRISFTDEEIEASGLVPDEEAAEDIIHELKRVAELYGVF